MGYVWGGERCTCAAPTGMLDPVAVLSLVAVVAYEAVSVAMCLDVACGCGSESSFLLAKVCVSESGTFASEIKCTMLEVTEVAC